MYLKRKIDHYLEQWKSDPEHLPLVIQGARQVGKTASIKRFAEKNYKYFVEINFAEEPNYKGIIEDGYKAESIVRHISRQNPSFRFVPDETLIFFDELQEFPEIATSLKFFQIDGRFDVICSGSLLGLQFKRIESNSVGYKTDYTMRSFDFEEYLWALGYPEDFSNEMLSNMLEFKPFATAELSRYYSIFMDYIQLGGMPAVISSFISTKTFEKTLAIQKQIIKDYREDIQKYAEGLEKARILSVFDNIAPQLSKENKKFQLSHVADGARSREYFGCVEWLLNAGIASICHCLNYPTLPLKGNYNESKYKLYLSDTGLLIASLEREAAEDLRKNKNLGIYKGALYENLVAEALVKEDYDLFYYKKEDSSLEEDFFLRTANNLIPVEVKAGNSVSRSLRNLISMQRYPEIQWGIKLVHGNVGRTDNIITFPYFCAYLLRRFLKEQH